MTATLIPKQGAAASQDQPPPVVRTSRWRLWAALGVLAVWLVGYLLFKGEATLFLPLKILTPFQQWLNDVRDWIDVAKNTQPLVELVLGGITDALNWVYNQLAALFSTAPFPRPVPKIGWLGTIAIAAWVTYALANLRIAALVVGGLLLCGFLGFWQDTLNTLIVTGMAVTICAVVGLPLGIWMARSKRVSGIVTPVLDVMQTMPSFAYLAPLALFFGIGAACAIVVTLVYALPPLVRISAHGLRSVSPTTLEATTSLGSTSTQQLRKVQVPMARRTIVVGLNQTIMAALSMVVIAAFVNGPGLGTPVIEALASLNVGVAFVAGSCIVILAILLDRTTTAASERAEVAARGGGSRLRRPALVVGGIVVLVLVYLSHVRLWAAAFPDRFEWGPPVARAINSASEWFITRVDTVSTAVQDFVTFKLLNPLQNLLAESPWWLVAGAVLALTVILAGLVVKAQGRAAAAVVLGAAAVAMAGFWEAQHPSVAWWLWWGAIVALVAGVRALGVRGAFVSTTVCLAILIGVGVWNSAMVTLAMTLVATVVVMLLGVVVGVWMGRSRRADLGIRPFLDFLQTMPQMVYLIPFVALFNATRFTAIVAAVAYAAPAAIKIIADGISTVSETTVEAARAAGTNRWQMITKVQLPMARGSLVLAANQGLLYVLAVVVLGALVGAGGLGYLVIDGFSQESDFGKGLAAGIAITALGVMLDRITSQSAARLGRAEPV